MNPDADLFELRDRCAHIDGITSQAVKLGDIDSLSTSCAMAISRLVTLVFYA